MITARPHYSLMAEEDSSQRRIQIAWEWSRIGSRTIIQALARATDGYDSTHLLHKDGDDNIINIVKILAQIIESENSHAAKVVLEKDLPKEIENAVEPFRPQNISKPIGRPNRVFLAVVGRTEVHMFQKVEAAFADYAWPAYSTEANIIPDAYPLSIKIWGESLVTGSVRENSIAELKKKQIQEFWDGKATDETGPEHKAGRPGSVSNSCHLEGNVLHGGNVSKAREPSDETSDRSRNKNGTKQMPRPSMPNK